MNFRRWTLAESLKTRRGFLLALAAFSLATRHGASAQQRGKLWRVGLLSPRRRPASLDSDYYGAFPRTMKTLGYVEGQNLSIEWRFANGEYERLPAQQGPQIAAQAASQRLPSIFANREEAGRSAELRPGLKSTSTAVQRATSIGSSGAPSPATCRSSNRRRSSWSSTSGRRRRWASRCRSRC